MIDVVVYNRRGEELEKLQVDTEVLGGVVRPALIKQALVRYQGNRRVGTAATKNKSLIEGSTRKLYRQKGTGNARAGQLRTPKRVGGGVTFAKAARSFEQAMPRKQRKLATDSAVLAKLLTGRVVVVDELNFDKPRTKDFAAVLGNLKIDRSCLVTIGKRDENVFKSARNIERIAVLPVAELNAWDVCKRHKVLFTKEAFLMFVQRTAVQD